MTAFVCRYCQTKKELTAENFKPEHRTVLGFDTVCRPCRRKERNSNRAKNRDNSLVKEAAYRNTKQYKFYHKKYWDTNKDKLSELSKARYQQDRTPYLQRSKEQKKRDPERYKAYLKKWREENRAYCNSYIVQRLHTDVNFKLRHTLRTKLRKVLNGLNKTNSALKYLGCSIEFFRGYLEAKFTDEMTWDNYGKIWHIDHIIPCISFDMKNETEREKCFHYTNLQPLLASINNAKRDKMPDGTSTRKNLTIPKVVL